MSFDQNSKFDPNKGYGTVKFGARKPVLETELNELQEIQNHARAEIIRSMVHSGVLEHSSEVSSGLYSTQATPRGKVQVPASANYSGYLNFFATNPFKAIINGNLLEISHKSQNPSSSTLWNSITLPEPPTEGTREDLVFLEAWFEEVDSIKDPAIKDARIGEETSRRTKLNWRIRTVAGVDFSKYPEGLGNPSASSSNFWIDAGNVFVTPQGGNVNPLDIPSNPNTTNEYVRFIPLSVRQGTSTTGVKIALEDVGLYTCGNGNQTSKDLLKTADGYVYAIPLFRVKRRNSGGYSQNNGNGAKNCQTVYLGGISSADTSGKVGATIVAKGSAPTINYLKVGDKIHYGSTNNAYYLVENININTLEVTLRILIGGLGSTSDYYIGSDRPDGKFANIVHQDDIIDLRHKVSLTGVNYDQLLEENFDKLLRGELRTKEGQKMLKTYHGVPKTPIDANHVFYASFDGTTVAERGDTSNIASGDFVPSATGLGIRNPSQNIINVPSNGGKSIDFFVSFQSLKDSSVLWLSQADAYESLLELVGGALRFRSWMNSGNNGLGSSASSVLLKPNVSYHIRIDLGVNSVNVYLNGALIIQFSNGTKVFEKPFSYIRLRYHGYGTAQYADMTISDLSISNISRGNVFSTLPKDFIDGYAVIDKAFNMQRRNLSDAQTSQYTTSIAKPKSQVSDRGITVEKGTGVNETIFETGDKIKVKGIAGEVITGVIDTVVKFGDGETVKTVVGTWTNLGTNEATFTLGENVNLDTEDVFIEYSLNSPNGQGGIPEVLTEVLEGEYLGQKYIKGAPLLKADFRGKVAGSELENPHLVRHYHNSPTLRAPNEFTSHVNTDIDKIKNLDGVLVKSGSTPVAGGFAQQLFSFDIVAEVERQLGRIPKATKAEKIQWLKDNLNVINSFWYGMGQSPTGSGAKLKVYNNSANVWTGGVSHFATTNSTVTKLGGSIHSYVSLTNAIDSNGFVHVLAHADASDGVTASTINTDYVELELEFKSPTGYDTLTPAEPFHNGTQKNFFFIRKETKEIEMMFNCDEDFGVVTWGDYTPYQGSIAEYAYSATTSALVSNPKTIHFTTQGTGSPVLNTEPNNFFVNVVGRVAGNTEKSADYLSVFLNKATSANINRGMVIHPLTSPHVNTASRRMYYLDKTLSDNIRGLGNVLGMVPFLAVSNGEIYLVVFTRNSNDVNVVNHGFGAGTANTFKLEGRPLVKGV